MPNINNPDYSTEAPLTEPDVAPPVHPWDTISQDMMRGSSPLSQRVQATSVAWENLMNTSEEIDRDPHDTVRVTHRSQYSLRPSEDMRVFTMEAGNSTMYSELRRVKQILDMYPAPSDRSPEQREQLMLALINLSENTNNDLSLDF